MQDRKKWTCNIWTDHLLDDEFWTEIDNFDTNIDAFNLRSLFNL